LRPKILLLKVEAVYLSPLSWDAVGGNVAKEDRAGEQQCERSLKTGKSFPTDRGWVGIKIGQTKPSRHRKGVRA